MWLFSKKQINTLEDSLLTAIENTVRNVKTLKKKQIGEAS